MAEPIRTESARRDASSRNEPLQVTDGEEQRLRTGSGSICPGPINLCSSEVSRRGLVKVGLGGLLSMLFAQWLDPRGSLAEEAPGSKRAKACILLWMNGGPSQLDTWDPKPGSSSAGSTRTIKTRTPGVTIANGLAQLAEVSDRLAIVRGMTSKEGNHQRAQYLMHTGYAPNPTITHPSLGGWVSEELGDPSFDLPNFVSISGPSMSAGFLGVQYGPLVINQPGQLPQNVRYATEVDQARFDSRGQALNMLEDDFASRTGDIKVKGRQAVYAKAVRMMRSPRLKAFDISEEPDSVKAAYGGSDFGRGCLMARRLVEAGVKFVEVVLDGWDTHLNNFDRVGKLTATCDPGMATLIKDLEQRKLLDSTLILWMGEFGRTPTINGNDGRDHYPNAWSAVLAGGGVRGGQAYGQTDADGTKVVEGSVTVPDLFATITTLLGMSPAKTFQTPIGRPISITEKGTPVRNLIS